MKQKVERETMNDRASTCTSGVCVYIYVHIYVYYIRIYIDIITRVYTLIYTCNTYMYLAGIHSSRTEPVVRRVARARRFISCAANE